MSERFLVQRLDNGLTLLAERMNGVRSAAMNLLVPAGAATDPVDRDGSANVLSDWILRGAGERDSRQLTDYFDSLGLQRGSGVGVHHTSVSCRGLADKVVTSLPTYGDVVRRARLNADDFEAARDLAVQAVEGIEDDPRQKLMMKLAEWHLPSPFGRSSMGRIDTLQKLTPQLGQVDYARRYQPDGAILAVAGDVDFGHLREAVEQHFGDWRPTEPVEIRRLPPPGRRLHEHQDSEQTHIGIAWNSIPETHEDYYVMRLAIEILSGGMSGRLFTEIREKRGLVYNVWAGYSGLKDYGAIFGYAGTSSDRAQATLDVYLAELQRLTQGVTGDELERAKVCLKSGTIMQGESSGARAGAIAHDYFHHGRIRTLDEIKRQINAVTLDRINGWLKLNPPGPYTIVTVGPKPLEMPD